MSKETKVILRNVGILLVIVMSLASVVGAAFITYDNAKESKADVSALQVRVQTIETNQARFEGIIDERTRNTAKRVDDIYAIVKEWERE